MLLETVCGEWELQRQELLQRNKLYTLVLEDGASLQVLHSRHRLKAAAQYLTAEQGLWWIVKLYDDGTVT